ncbi:MAG: hypothetical protein WC178_05860 [Candidatus Paceibacterota bacterium]
MEHLYLGSYIKKNKIKDALLHARYKKLLQEVSESEIDAFLEGFEKVIEKRHLKFGDKISHHEMEEIISILRRDHTDIVNDRELQTIADVLLDKDFVL